VNLKVRAAYVVDLRSKDFPPLLRLEDSAGKQLAINESGGGRGTARLLVLPDRDEKYWLIATSTQPKKTGDYVLTVRRLDEAGKPNVTRESLTANDPLLEGCRYRVHKIRMSAGKHYRIDMESSELDPLLIVKDAAGATLAADDDGGGGLNARLLFSPARDDEYQIVLTTYQPGTSGIFTLHIQEYAESKTSTKERAAKKN
jgi:hypothetical protein